MSLISLLFWMAVSVGVMMFLGFVPRGKYLRKGLNALNKIYLILILHDLSKQNSPVRDLIDDMVTQEGTHMSLSEIVKHAYDMGRKQPYQMQQYTENTAWVRTGSRHSQDESHDACDRGPLQVVRTQGQFCFCQRCSQLEALLNAKDVVIKSLKEELEATSNELEATSNEFKSHLIGMVE